jgi:hypothetical protein
MYMYIYELTITVFYLDWGKAIEHIQHVDISWRILAVAYF